MMYDFTLFFSDCTENYADFDTMAEACEAIDPQCAPDYDSQDVTFYNFDFGDDYRQEFCKQAMNKSNDFIAAAIHQINVQKQFRMAMASLF